jgi:LDH2 family malate/lactate/ureidoglycolate dehydrogenase
MEFHAIRERRERGIPIAPAVVRQLRALAADLGLPFSLAES